MFPVDASGKPTQDQVGALIDLAMDPAKVPGKVTLRDLAPEPVVGESKYGFNLYLRERGDANIKTIDDLLTKSKFFNDPYEGDKRATLENNNKPLVLDSAARLQRRFAVQQIILQAMADLKLDAVVYPTGLLPPRKINTPRDPNFNGIGNYGMWTFLGVQGLPAVTVPAGFTAKVWDSGASAPVDVRLPVGMDLLGRPFSEPVLLKIAAVYATGTKLREAPPDYGPVK